MHTEDDQDEELKDEKHSNNKHHLDTFYTNYYDDDDEPKLDFKKKKTAKNDDYIDDRLMVDEDDDDNFDFREFFNGILKSLKRFFSNKFNVILTTLTALILVFGVMFVYNLAHMEEDIIISGDYVDGRYDFNNTLIVVKKDSSNKIMKLDEFVECMAHHKIDSIASFNRLGDSQKKNVYKTYYVIMKSIILSKGYNSNTKTIYLNEKDFNCCNSVSCDLPNDKYPLLYDAYLDTKHEILVPKNFNTNNAFVSYTDEIKFDVTDEVIASIISKSANNTNYDKIINSYFSSNHKIYNMEDHANAYKTNSNIKTSFYWPIGSNEATKDKFYAGTPVNSSIITFYDGNENKGIEIEAKYGTKIIAISSGTVLSVMRTNDLGWFVKVNHGEYIAIYANLNPNVVNNLKMNDKVEQGQLIGYLQNDDSVLSSDGKLIFQLYKNNQLVDPLLYVSEANPRPKNTKYLTYVSGSNNKQTVCLSLLATGFSKEAVTGLLANIQAESNFKTTIYGDNGTSYGICQWHLGRFSNLKKYCGNRYKTLECQLDYLLYELRNGEKNSFKVLQGKNTAYQMVTKFCQVFERPAGGAKACNRRADNFASSFYKYVQNKCK